MDYILCKAGYFLSLAVLYTQTYCSSPNDFFSWGEERVSEKHVTRERYSEDGRTSEIRPPCCGKARKVGNAIPSPLNPSSIMTTSISSDSRPILKSSGAWHLIDGTEVAPTEASALDLERWEMHDACAWLQFSIDIKSR